MTTLVTQRMDEIRRRLAAGNFAVPGDRQELLKRLVGWHIAGFAKSGQVIALGSGSTSKAAILALRERAEVEGLALAGVATSSALAELAMGDGLIQIPVMPLDILRGARPAVMPSWGFDGVDEFEAGTGRVIKGGGAAHVLERIVARMILGDWYLIADQSKVVPALGKFPVPVEVANDHDRALGIVQIFLDKYGAQKAEIRSRDGNPVLTDGGNLIIDVHMGQGNIPMGIETEWLQIPGVVPDGVGIFVGMGRKLLVAQDDGTIKEIPGAAK